MKEENQMLREQDLIRNELLARYEKRNEDMAQEVSGVLPSFPTHPGLNQ